MLRKCDIKCGTMTKPCRWNFLKNVEVVRKIPIIQYWCGTNAIISCWVPAAKGHQINKPQTEQLLFAQWHCAELKCLPGITEPGLTLSVSLPRCITRAPWGTPANGNRVKQRSGRFIGAASLCPFKSPGHIHSHHHIPHWGRWLVSWGI